MVSLVHARKLKPVFRYLTWKKWRDKTRIIACFQYLGLCLFHLCSSVSRCFYLSFKPFSFCPTRSLFISYSLVLSYSHSFHLSLFLLICLSPALYISLVFCLLISAFLPMYVFVVCFPYSGVFLKPHFVRSIPLFVNPMPFLFVYNVAFLVAQHKINSFFLSFQFYVFKFYQKS